MPEETIADLETPEFAWALLEPWGDTPETCTMERHAVYTFQARRGRPVERGTALIAGDAAHLMAPLAGQGMCAGIRDAANIGWELDLVLRELAPSGLLDTYTGHRARLGFGARPGHVQGAISADVDVTDLDFGALRQVELTGAPPQRISAAG